MRRQYVRLASDKLPSRLAPQPTSDKDLVTFGIVVRLHFPLVAVYLETLVPNPVVNCELENSDVFFLFVITKDGLVFSAGTGSRRPRADLARGSVCALC